ncbi:MAG: hypothetical protein HC781_16015 [Leptolyngbyaceae cyanobacterium CSU_1_4]|nr:hypothetical protein [Leptolyngbyaceae cyanobacterium CSU_1_4]
MEANVRFINNIYKPCIENCKVIGGDIQNVLETLDHGKAVLDTGVKCDQYIAFYGGHHFHKLFTAFTSTNFQYTNGKNLEIIDWGCGQALATCVLIDYFVENNLNPNIVSITLIEPSQIALKRGYNFVCQMRQYKLCAGSTVQMVNKYMDDLSPNDLVSDIKNIKVHLFSNIIDVETFSLDKLHGLVLNSFQGLNRFICTSPGGDRSHRLSKFHNLFSQSCQISNLVISEEPIYKEIFYFKTRRYNHIK